MFWSLVRPDRILPPITRSAAVTTSLEADESAVGMIICECSTLGLFGLIRPKAKAPRGVLRFETIGLFWTAAAEQHFKTMRLSYRLSFETVVAMRSTF